MRLNTDYFQEFLLFIWFGNFYLMPLFKKQTEADAAPNDLDEEVASAFVALGRRDQSAPVPAGLAKETLVSLMFRHAELLSQTMKKQESATLYELAVQLAGYENSALSDGKSVEDLRSLGATLMSAGRIQLAIKIYEQIIKQEPDDHDDHIRLSSLYYAEGRKEEAHGFLQSFFIEHPTSIETSDREEGSLGRILRFSGFDKTQFKMARRENGSFRYYRSGGHFMLAHLLDSSSFDVHSFVVAGDNLSKKPPTGSHDLILNTIADADTEFSSLKSLEKYLETNTKTPLINHPTRVLATTRDNNYRTLNDIEGIRFPKTRRFNTTDIAPSDLAAQMEANGFGYPLIVRETGTHTAISTALVDDRETLEAYIAAAGGDCLYAIEFIESASEQGHYSKMRFFAIDGDLYPVVHHIDEVWNVHGGNRKTFMARHDWMLEKEQRFMADPASVIGDAQYQLLQTLPDIIGLDFFGFDFTLLADGTVLIFELNPAMRHGYSHAENFPYLQPHLEAVESAFKAMVRRKIASGRQT